MHFKRLMGGSLGPVQAGAFLARLGLLIFVLGGAAIGALMHAGVYRLEPSALPKALLAETAGLSLAFNFSTTFGLSLTSPVVVSLATQLGIPLNLAIDLLFQGSSARALDPMAIAGVVLMLCSFTLSAVADHVGKRRSGGWEGAGVAEGSQAGETVAVDESAEVGERRGGGYSRLAERALETRASP